MRPDRIRDQVARQQRSRLTRVQVEGRTTAYQFTDPGIAPDAVTGVWLKTWYHATWDTAIGVTPVRFESTVTPMSRRRIPAEPDGAIRETLVPASSAVGVIARYAVRLFSRSGRRVPELPVLCPGGDVYVDLLPDTASTPTVVLTATTITTRHVTFTLPAAVWTTLTLYVHVRTTTALVALSGLAEFVDQWSTPDEAAPSTPTWDLTGVGPVVPGQDVVTGMAYVDLRFRPNPEPDLLGYGVYRYVVESTGWEVASQIDARVLPRTIAVTKSVEPPDDGDAQRIFRQGLALYDGDDLLGTVQEAMVVPKNLVVNGDFAVPGGWTEENIVYEYEDFLYGELAMRGDASGDPGEENASIVSLDFFAVDATQVQTFAVMTKWVSGENVAALHLDCYDGDEDLLATISTEPEDFSGDPLWTQTILQVFPTDEPVRTPVFPAGTVWCKLTVLLCEDVSTPSSRLVDGIVGVVGETLFPYFVREDLLATTWVRFVEDITLPAVQTALSRQTDDAFYRLVLKDSTHAEDTDTMVFRDTEVLVNGAYRYALEAIDRSGNRSARSELVESVTAIDTTPPGPVTNLKATASDRTVLLSWTPPGDADYAGVYVVEDSVWGMEVISARGAIAETTITYDAGGDQLVNGQSYTFVVIAKDRHGNQSTGVSIQATPGATTFAQRLYVESPGQTDFPLFYVPSSYDMGTITLNVNGGEQTRYVDYDVVYDEEEEVAVMTWTSADFDLDLSDRVVIAYIV